MSKKVKIDPEDREAVRALILACPDDWCFTSDTETEAEVIGHLQAALRSLLAPPKPEEPTGLGAVVETRTGEHYVRLHSSPEWISDEGVCRKYRYLDVARVLSEGVA